MHIYYSDPRDNTMYVSKRCTNCVPYIVIKTTYIPKDIYNITFTNQGQCMGIASTNTKGAIGNRRSMKNRQHNGQKKQDKQP